MKGGEEDAPLGDPKCMHFDRKNYGPDHTKKLEPKRNFSFKLEGEMTMDYA
jgi:hypothetical protein